MSCQGKCPKDLPQLADAVSPPRFARFLPDLGDYLPGQEPDFRTRSATFWDRWVLAANAPEIPASAVNFDFGTEGEIAHYRTPAGPSTLAVFSFPLHPWHASNSRSFRRLRAPPSSAPGRLVAVAIGPSAAIGKLLEAINYQGVVAENEKPPEKPLELKPESAGQMVLAILSLAGLLLVFCLLSGLAVGGTLRLARRFGYSGAEGSMTTLHLEGK